MSIPPQLIRVKRKRVEEAPVTFLQFDQDSKRHRSGSNWAYQRRKSTTQQPSTEDKSTRPIIHVSKSNDAQSSGRKQDGPKMSPKPEHTAQNSSGPTEPRRFHVSRAVLAKAAQNQKSGGVSKKSRYNPAVFIESTRKKKTPKPRKSLATGQLPIELEGRMHTSEQTLGHVVVEQKQLKRPGVVNKTCAGATQQKQQQPITRAPLPDSLMNRHNEDMDKITKDMNQWVLNELGSNLQSMEHDNRPPRFKPKSPAKRYHERHPKLSSLQISATQLESTMSDPSDEDGDDDDDDDDEWVIEEYVRIPARYVALDISPTEVGILVLDNEEESMLFFGSALDDDDELAEDDEDENAENHYTADYPEDEVESDDEYGRQAYVYRHGNNSDEEEYDESLYQDQDELVLDCNADDDDDARMARIKEFMKRNSAFR
ncbi:hypothetical protein QQS21_009125 [Conoideocrella luteorostrata]|uniref:Transcription factor Iwr1 domain-containing protein n=1 Tax=Conoideocrella luteorostrata TaxID=1105319 RepID=A0AAJ0CHG6_9HYPO|nr:hypothetical protein QQS21_009125 [Conoideocrella luteorostrata]